MEIEKTSLEFDDKEINELILQLNRLHNSQQQDFANLCYTVYKIDCWFEDNPECLLKSKLNEYYNKKQLFNSLGLKKSLVTRYCQCYEKFMTLSSDVGTKLKEPFVSFTSSKLFELLPLGTEKLIEFINNGQITPQMTVKEIREFLKSIEEKTEITEDVDDEEKNFEENFIILKNDTARKDFLDNYMSWGLWFEEPRLRLKYYRCKIGEMVLVAVQHFYKLYSDKESYDVSFFRLNDVGSLSVSYSMPETELLSKMKAVQDKKVYLFN